MFFSPHPPPSFKPLFFSELGFFHSSSLNCRPLAQRFPSSYRSLLFSSDFIHREVSHAPKLPVLHLYNSNQLFGSSALITMANEITSDMLEKVAAQFSGLLEWVKQPANQTSNAVPNEEANAVPNKEVNAVVNEEEPKSSMYPEHHKHVAENLEEDGLEYTFRQDDQKVGIKRVHDTKVIGEFACRKRNCRRSWFSNSIAIRIREYEGSQYNVQVYHQQCSQCEKPTRAKLNKLAYADRVAFYIKR
ncbi:hypothetical protein FPCIR_6719 [Fusarium pseudocircinatum]|uniref:3CxxC-type domain-containing protein n=1 Tax=Fusarium pseudocircinatum TaxID=56676 RepID=A0A8H5P477_9HYPO|nr:hypothetical protein FPCIR_6719 [Fusarium pseudocircinatum]